ncbi:hypothetical protein VOLCADRAFT_91444 [Volvox carteri f. nagariensis]|uniref:Uncharacterized protein n=1 Tax=Volvox carteri f. nagariensis TaxID=3068 RepID=D8TX37_VOLCA|nr:uncharacterized protein VOLCADRAFT_91444 [Volvox carteri f. nagariensis]EFJ47942.1 hypothetical protein VOLCADRAFT_91444 [Volvox carteri f. nagariensis]|eukprot:XP_002951048.1 hypothetical protein VOLCADRAFT_91444 [Volvox carteri f. nagariensis]
MAKGGKAVMVVELKGNVVFNHIWQPLATAIELAILNCGQDPVTVLLTDAKQWYFASVQLIGEADKQEPSLPEGELRACNHQFRLFNCERIPCNLLLRPGTDDYGPVAKVFARMHSVLYPGVDITRVAHRAKLGNETLQTLANKWAEPFITELYKKKNDPELKEIAQKAEREKKEIEQKAEREKKEIAQKAEREKKEIAQKLEASEREKTEIAQKAEREKKEIEQKAEREIEALKRQLQQQQGH